eukprot:GFKZ01007458.1.p2 GENE.GFKZ01007458.1~~GFKZ01007458.1.p2  ORF type:complete len:101 (-),score=11.08 GFKZ01007458.1:170-472(-)
MTASHIVECDQIKQLCIRAGFMLWSECVLDAGRIDDGFAWVRIASDCLRMVARYGCIAIETSEYKGECREAWIEVDIVGGEISEGGAGVCGSISSRWRGV